MREQHDAQENIIARLERQRNDRKWNSAPEGAQNPPQEVSADLSVCVCVCLETGKNHSGSVRNRESERTEQIRLYMSSELCGQKVILKVILPHSRETR